MKQKNKRSPFIAVFPAMLLMSCGANKPKGCEPPDCHMNPPPQSIPTAPADPPKQPETKPLGLSGCEPPDCHMNPPPQSIPAKTE